MVIEPKEPSVGDTVKVKDGRQVYSGKVVGSGKKTEVDKLMLDMEREQVEEPVDGKTCE